MIKIHPKIVYRVPCFPINAKIEDYWPELKKAISESSPEFFEIIQHINTDDLSSLPSKVIDTIWKYFNRAKFRATPYGSFAGIGLNDLTKDSSTIIIEDQKLHHFIDWSKSQTLNFDFKILVESNAILQTNSSYYLVGDVIRYIAKTDVGFALSEIDIDPSILDLLEHCLQQTPISSFSAEPERLDLIENLIINQLLFTSLTPNIIGDDYFTRIGIREEHYNNVNYIVAERPCIQRGMIPDIFKDLPAAVELLNQLNPPVENPTLNDFINRFTKKFEQTEVPLIVALDPELGIGYDDLELSSHEDAFLNKLAIEIEKAADKNAGALSNLLIKALIDQNPKVDAIDLSSLETRQDKSQTLMPNTLSTICYVADEKVIIESIGGYTANALLGRFTMVNNELHTFCRELASFEKNANPEILFFDIAYQSEGRVDNINRRKSIYDYQLSIHDYDTTKNPLHINDLMISVIKGEVILRSISLNKRMVPKMTTAYNPIRSDLSIFRLLCDLQHQKINTALSFSLSRLIPDLNYYPRVVFESLILCTRKWKINYHNDTNHMATLIKDIIDSGCQIVKHGLADQTLCFDLLNEMDVAILMKQIKKHQTIYLEEVIRGEKSIVKDTFENEYLPQFVVTLYHRNPVYKGIDRILNTKTASVQKSFAPGSEWLYLQLYLHPFLADNVLLNEINEFLNEYNNKINSYFFIRYNENGNHIRLRLKLNDVKDVGHLLSAFSKKLSEKTEQGVISDIKVCTYQREGERYGWNYINEVEEIFFIDSKCTLAILASEPSTEEKYQYTMQLIEAVSTCGIFEYASFKTMLNNVLTSFQSEHNWGTVEFKKLNDHYKEVMNQPVDLNNLRVYFPLNLLVLGLTKILQTCNNSHQQQKLFIDLVHMHVNRLHASKQRHHEAVIYYFAVKELLKKEALLRRPIKSSIAT